MPEPLLFDRQLLKQRWIKAAPNFHSYDALYNEVVDRVVDRLVDVKKPLAHKLFLGARNDRFPKIADMQVEAFPGNEPLSFLPQSFDAIISVLSLHWTNDLPKTLDQIRQILQPDGFFLAAFLGGDTLIELRTCLTQAEVEITGGASPRVSPTVSVSDATTLLQRAGFSMPVVDSDPLTLTYDHPLTLLHELKGMGETNALTSRRRTFLRRDVLTHAIQLYQQQFSEPDGRVPATFQVIYLAGWSPP